MAIKSKTDQLLEIITEKIQNRVYKSGYKIPPERELQKEYSVCRNIVRRAIDILEERQIVERRLGSGTYVLDGAEKIIKSLDKNKKTPVLKIGFVMIHHWVRNGLFHDMFRMLEENLPERVEIKAYFQQFLNKNILKSDKLDILILNHYYSDLDIESISDLDMKTIVIFRKSDISNYVAFKDEESGYVAGKYLAEKGHRKVAFFEVLPNSGEGMYRIRGFLRACEDFDLKTTKVTIDRESSIINLRTGIDYLLSSEVDFTAIFCLDDLMALQIYDLLTGRGIKVPEKISIIGNNDIFFASRLGLPLTTVHVPYNELINSICDAVGEYMKTGKLELKKEISSYVIERESVRDFDLKGVNNTCVGK